MSKRISVYSINQGLIVTLHADVYVWTKRYQSDLMGIAELGDLGLFETTDAQALAQDYPVPDDFDTGCLEAAGFTKERASFQ